MSIDRTGKAFANENKYPFIVEVPVLANGLEVDLNRQIIGFHKSRRVMDVRYFATAKVIIGGAFPIWKRLALCRTVWRSVLQDNWHLARI
jgi:hypothetical protein